MKSKTSIRIPHRISFSAGPLSEIGWGYSALPGTIRIITGRGGGKSSYASRADLNPFSPFHDSAFREDSVFLYGKSKKLKIAKFIAVVKGFGPVAVVIVEEKRK